MHDHLVGVTRTTAMQLSPITLTASQGLKVQHCKVLVVVGEDESVEFHRQAKEYYELIKGLLTNVTFLEVPGVSHFNIMEQLLEKDFTLVKVTISFFNRGHLHGVFFLTSKIVGR